MSTSVLKPAAITPNLVKRHDVGRGNRQWTFINRSSYYVVVRMDFSEGELGSNPELVIEPYSTQKVSFPERKDKICWKADSSFPRAANPTNAAEVFGFVASDIVMQAYPASILNVGLTDAPQPQIQASAATLANLENVDNPAGSVVARMRAKGTTQDQLRIMNDGDFFIGNGTVAPGKFIEASGAHRQIMSPNPGAGLMANAESAVHLGSNCYFDAAVGANGSWMRYNTARGGSLYQVSETGLFYRTFAAGTNPIAFNPTDQVAFLKDIPAPPPPELTTAAQSKQVRAPGATNGLAMLSGQMGSHMTTNAFWDGTNWMRYDTAAGGAVVQATASGLVLLTFPAGANPITFNPRDNFSTNKLPQLIAGPPLQTGWTAAAFGFRKLDDGMVVVRGHVTSPTTGWTAGTVVFVMPAGFRPFSTHAWVAMTTDGRAIGIRMENTGNLLMPVAGTAQVTFMLNPMVYLAEA